MFPLRPKYAVLLAVFVVGMMMPGRTLGQPILERTITLQVERQRLDDVLDIIGNKADFFFSYNSSIVARDSVVTLAEFNRSVRQVLDALFQGRYEYRESGKYLILKRAASPPAPQNESERSYTISGYVVDRETGERIAHASIYEPNRLVSTLTDNHGAFHLKFRNKTAASALVVSKTFYRDTTMIIRSKADQQWRIHLSPVDFPVKAITARASTYTLPDSIEIFVGLDSAITTYLYHNEDSVRVERTVVGRFLLSTSQKMQSLNLKDFFAERPFQVSVIPGIGTHGRLSQQIANTISFNVLGGYSGGVEGVEIGGLFNLDRKDVRYVQVAGLFNVVGGHAVGVQIGGLHNAVFGSTTGFQGAGINNFSRGSVRGVQLGGIYNHANGSLRGAQLSGICNFVNAEADGLQLAGIANISRRSSNGLQVAGLVNYTKKLTGVQFGLINIADTSDGYSIGLINVVLKGYHKLSLSTNEVMNVNAAFKTGNAKLYSMLMAGAHVGEDTSRIYAFGYGLGKELRLAKWLSLNPELSSQYLYLGSWDYLNLLNRLSVNLNLKLGKHFSLFAGPAVSVYYSRQMQGVHGFRFDLIPSGHRRLELEKSTTAWIGWTAGLHLF